MRKKMIFSALPDSLVGQGYVTSVGQEQRRTRREKKRLAEEKQVAVFAPPNASQVQLIRSLAANLSTEQIRACFDLLKGKTSREIQLIFREAAAHQRYHYSNGFCCYFSGPPDDQILELWDGERQMCAGSTLFVAEYALNFCLGAVLAIMKASAYNFIEGSSENCLAGALQRWRNFRQLNGALDKWTKLAQNVQYDQDSVLAEYWDESVDAAVCGEGGFKLLPELLALPDCVEFVGGKRELEQADCDLKVYIPLKVVNSRALALGARCRLLTVLDVSQPLPTSYDRIFKARPHNLRLTMLSGSEKKMDAAALRKGIRSANAVRNAKFCKGETIKARQTGYFKSWQLSRVADWNGTIPPPR